MNASMDNNDQRAIRPTTSAVISLALVLLGLLLIGGQLWAVRELRQAIKEIGNQVTTHRNVEDQAQNHDSVANTESQAVEIDLPITRFDHPGGRFVKEERIWREYGHPHPTYAFYFRELNRDHAWLYLRDDSRGIDVKLPFRGGQMYLKYYTSTPGDWGPLYVVQPVRQSAGAQPVAKAAAATTSAENTLNPRIYEPIVRFEHSNGQFVKVVTNWIEYGNEVNYTFTFREISRDESWIYVRDDSRQMSARFPVRGGAMYLHADDCHPDIWYPYLIVKPVTAASTLALNELGDAASDSQTKRWDNENELHPPAEPVRVPDPTTPSNIPRAFTWNYVFQPEPGLRVWRLLNGRMFVERYPSGHENVFVVVRSDTVEGNRGTVVQLVGGQMQAFIPDKDSEKMWLKIRANGSANWQFMGEINNVE